MDCINNLQITSITKIATKPLQANTLNVSKRYTVSNVMNENNNLHTSIKNIVVCTKSAQEKQQVIDFYNQEYPTPQVVKLDNHNDLTDNDLLNIISCDTTGNLTVTTGRLFNSEPLLLIIDLTNMIPGEIARLNELLSIPASYNGKAISSKVKIVVIIDDSMLDFGISKPSADLWRRLAKFNFLSSVFNLYSSSIAELQQANDVIMPKELLAIKIKEFSNLEKNNQATIIDFATANSPQELLFGSLTLDDKGKIYFKNGCLQNITNNNIILHNAPWYDSKFTDLLATALCQKGFRANGNWVTLPANLQLTKSFTSTQQVEELTNKYVITAENITSLNIHNLVIINSHNFEAVFADNKLHQTVVIATDTLAELTADCGYLLVTDQLTKEQWLKLLSRASILNDKKISILDASDNSSTIINQLTKSCLNNNLKCQTYQHIEDALVSVPANSLVYKITKDTNWIEIWQTVSLTSQEQFIFSQQDTELLTALKQGRLVTFYGLETNIEVLKNFETLLIKPSYLLLNGNKIILENNNICLLLDEKFNQTKFPQLLQNITTTQITDFAIVALDYQTTFIEQILEKLAQNNLTLIQDKKTIYTMFAKQLEIEQQQDQSQQLLAIHYRKAAHTIFAKQYRDNIKLYGYLKTQIATINIDNTNQQVADAEALLNWIKNNPNANRNSLAEDFWILARYCSPSCFASTEKNIADFNFAKIQNKAVIDKLANIILAIIPDNQKQFFMDRFAVNNYNNNQQIVYYNGSVRSTIIDAMLSANKKLKTTLPISEIATSLAFKIYHIKKNNSLEQAITNIFKLLSDVFPEEFLQTEFNDLATNLVASSVNSYRKQARKKQRLAARIKQYPIIFLQGIAGSGKSHMAQAVVNNLKKTDEFKNMPEPLVLSLGPETKASDLFGSQQLQQTVDDAYTKFIAGPILKWAINDNPPLLILDEANLVTDGVLSPLAGLTSKQPQLSYAGKVYKLSGKHRVIITGNPNSYDGRSMDSEISASMLTLYHKAMTANDLAELIIKPALNVNLSSDITAEIINSLIYLYYEYDKIIKHKLTARDLQDILSRINRIICYQNNSLGIMQIYGLVWHAVSEILFTSIINKPQIKLLLANYKEKFAIEILDGSALDTRDAKFEDFFNQLASINQNLELSSKAVKKLVKDYWMFLDSQANLLGRRGLWVEGPAGWGKDCILNAVLILWEQQKVCKNKFIHINANPNQWDKTVEIILTAMANGQKLVISEINLFPSRYLEGLFNDILTGAFNDGFMLFATVNPLSYSNRERLSVAFMNRMTQVNLDPIATNELYKILLKRYPNQPIMIEWLFSSYLDLSQALIQQQASIQLSLANLLETANKLVDANFKQWTTIFQQDYGLLILMLKNKAEDFKLRQPQNTKNKQLKVSKKKISSAGKRLNFKTITQAHDYHPIKYFATNKFSVSDYRLKLYRPVATVNGISYSAYKNSKQIQIISAPVLTSNLPVNLETGQLLGTAELELSTDNWVALPGISYNDECIGISHKDLIDLGRCQVTGFLMVKLKELKIINKFLNLYTSANEIKQHKKLKLDFIIKPNLISLAFAKVAKSIKNPNQDKYLKQLLDNNIFSSNINVNRSINKLQQIKLLTDKKQQIQELISWASCFKANMDITSEGYNAVIDAIRYQQGSCRHRAIIFQILAEYFGVATNCIGNDLHMFVEFSLDDKKTWISIDLGGADNPDTTIQITEHQFLDYYQAPADDKGTKIILTSKTDFIKAYSEKVQKLHNQPNQLINFLKFIVSIKNSDFSNTLIYNIWEDLYTENFYLYINSTTADFSKVLVKIFGDLVFLISNQGDNRKLGVIYYFFICSHQQFIDSKISIKTIKSISSACLSLIEDNKLIVTYLLFALENLTQDDKYQQRVQKILDNHYSGFKQYLFLEKLQETPFYHHHKSTDDNTVVTIKSKIITNILRETNIKTDWSYSSTGKSPSVNRLATRKPAFPISQNQQAQGKNIYFYLGMVETYKELCYVIYNKTTTPMQLSKFLNFVFTPFINWLFKQIPITKLNILIDINRGDDFPDNSKNNEKSLIYPPDYSVRYIKGNKTTYTYSFCVNLFCYSCFSSLETVIKYDLNENRVKQVFGDSAALITQDIITACFKEYLDHLQVTAV